MIVTSENQLQSALFQWTWNTYPTTRGHLWAVSNGMYTNKITAMKAKAMGLVAGVWDLHFFWEGKFHIIESKFGVGKLTDKQVWWGDLMVSHGATTHIYRSLDEGKNIIKKIIIFTI